MSKQKETKKYKNHELRSIYESLNGLDGIREGDIFTPFKFGGDALEKIIKNRLRLRPKILEIAEIEKKLFMQSSGGATTMGKNTSNFGDYTKAVTAFMAKEEEVEILPINWKDIKDNQIAPSAIENLVFFGVIVNFN